MAQRFSRVNERRSERTAVLVGAGVFVLVLLSVAVLALSGQFSSSPSGQAATVVVQEREEPYRKVTVIIPREQIEQGTKLEPAMFRIEERPDIGLPARVIKQLEEVDGQFARTRILAGDLLLADYMTTVRPASAITPKIPEGYRAVTINVNATSSVEGWALPGAKVDLVWASQIRGKPGVTVIVQNAQVLSAERMLDPNAQPGAPVPSTVTLLVTADDATKIALASTTGSLSLSLRGDADVGKGSTSGSMTVDDLLGGAVVSQAEKRNAGAQVKVRRPDGSFEVLRFNEEGGLVPAE